MDEKHDNDKLLDSSLTQISLRQRILTWIFAIPLIILGMLIWFWGIASGAPNN